MGGVLQFLAAALLVVSLMFASGLALQVADLRALLSRPRVVLGSLLVNVVLVPAVLFGLLSLLVLPPAVRLGLMLCFVPPAGPAAVLYVTRAGAELPLAVGLTILLPLVGLVTTPVTVSLIPGLPPDLALPVWPMVGTLLGFQLLPLVAGMVLRERRPTLAARLAPVSRRIGGLTLVTMVVVLLAVKGGVLREVTAGAWGAVLLACVVAVALGFVAGLPERGTARAGALVAVSRNISVALMLASTFARDPVVEGMVLSGGLAILIVPFVLASAWARRPD